MINHFLVLYFGWTLQKKSLIANRFNSAKVIFELERERCPTSDFIVSDGVVQWVVKIVRISDTIRRVYANQIGILNGRVLKRWNVRTDSTHSR